MNNKNFRNNNYARKNRPTKRYLVLLVLLIVLAAGLTGIAIHKHNSSSKAPVAAATGSKTYPAPTAADNTTSESTKSTNPTPTTTPTSGGQTTTPTPASSFAVFITSVNNSASSQNVHVGTQVTGITSGSCTIQATQGSQTVTVKSSTVVQDVNNYDCGAINIPYAAFPSSGSWKLELIVASNGVSETSTWPDPVSIAR